MSEPPAHFWSRVEFTDTCWLWRGALYENGYGSFYYQGKHQRAHRVAYEAEHGPIPNGLVMDHTCFVRECVRPAHLEPVTKQQNAQNRAGVEGLSGVRGVYWRSDTKRWQVKITVGYRSVSGGCYDNLDQAEEAARQLRLQHMTHNRLDRVSSP